MTKIQNLKHLMIKKNEKFASIKQYHINLKCLRVESMMKASASATDVLVIEYLNLFVIWIL